MSLRFLPLRSLSLLPLLGAVWAEAPAVWTPDRGDGTYQNPIFHADYSDPDAVRVGSDYWLTASSFNHVPGLPILHSRDLVNWTLVNHALPVQVTVEHFSVPRHGQGVWAPAIRHHAGKFWIFYPDPDFGIYVVTATDPRAPWSAPILVKAGKGLIDPCPFWDDDGQVYLLHGWAKSRSGKNNLLTLNRLSSDATRVNDGEGVVIIDENNSQRGFHTLEGPKFYKRGDTYWIFAPVDGVATGSQAVYRAKSITGPYDARVVLVQGATPINGPHQGAWVDTPGGQHWFLHFQDKGPYGRIVHLEPMAWREDGWPAMGTAVATGAEKGEPVLVHAKPALPIAPVAVPATSDEFAPGPLGRQWQWQANPRAGWATLAAGALRLTAVSAPAPANLYDASNLLLQKFPALDFTVTTALDASSLAVGESAGLVVFGYDYAWIGLRRAADGLHVIQISKKDGVKDGPATTAPGPAAVPAKIVLRVVVTAGAKCRFAYSTDGTTFTPLGAEFSATVGKWVGAKVGLFASAPVDAAAPTGSASFDYFRLTP